MDKPAEIWFNQPDLIDSEMIILAYPANHTQNGWRAVGGKLSVTNFRIIFTPNKIDRNFGGGSLEIGRQQIDRLFVKDRILSFKELFSGGLVARLGVKLKDDTEYLFVVSGLEQAKQEIEVALANTDAEQGAETGAANAAPLA